jgi:hypothetical protein
VNYARIVDKSRLQSLTRRTDDILDGANKLHFWFSVPAKLVEAKMQYFSSARRGENRGLLKVISLFAAGTFTAS